jgi:hypothetical protein
MAECIREVEAGHLSTCPFVKLLENEESQTGRCSDGREMQMCWVSPGQSILYDLARWVRIETQISKKFTHPYWFALTPGVVVFLPYTRHRGVRPHAREICACLNCAHRD